MCLIIQREPNFEIPFDKFKSAIITNPDGWGLAFAQDGRLTSYKSPVTPDPEKLYRVVNEELKEFPLLLHFRFNTAGKTNMRNAHPFPILEYDKDGTDLRMAHNGTISKFKQIAKQDESDSRAFVREFVRPLMKRMAKAIGPEAVLKDEFTQRLLSDQIPGGSVLSFLDGFGNTLNINELGNNGGREPGWYFSNKYSFNRAHREPVKTTSVVTRYPSYEYSDKSFDGHYNQMKDNKMADTNTIKFSKKYELTNADELMLMTDDTITDIIENAPDDAALLIKELIFELSVSKTACARYKRIVDTPKKVG